MIFASGIIGWFRTETLCKFKGHDDIFMCSMGYYPVELLFGFLRILIGSFEARAWSIRIRSDLFYKWRKLSLIEVELKQLFLTTCSLFGKGRVNSPCCNPFFSKKMMSCLLGFCWEHAIRFPDGLNELKNTHAEVFIVCFLLKHRSMNLASYSMILIFLHCQLVMGNMTSSLVSRSCNHSGRNSE